MLLAAASIRSFIDKKPYIFLLYSLLALPSLLLVEYGSLAVMFALLGFLVRKVDVEEKTQIIGFAAIVSYAVTLDLTFALNTLQEYGVAAIVFAAVYVTAQCSVKPSVALQKNPALVKSICFLTRYMYGYYILHILLLKALSIWLYPPEEIFVLRFF